MINLAVVEMKDVIKYLVKITIIITIVVALTRYFSSFKIKNSKEGNDKYTLLSCLDTVIPNIKDVNNKSNNSQNNNSKKPLRMVLGVELGMMDSIESNDNKKSNQTEENNNSNSIYDNDEGTISEAKTGVKTEVQETNVPQKFTTTYNTVKIKNETKTKLTQQMLTPDVKINTKKILIYHTHTCESYTPSEKYTYKKSGNFRTTDKTRSVVRVGTELTKYMKNYGYSVVHDTTLYDYPSYNGSYNRSYTNVGKLLDKNEGTEIVFDIHRDAIGDSSYAPTVKIGDEYAAQLLFVIGGNGERYT